MTLKIHNFITNHNIFLILQYLNVHGGILTKIASRY